MIKFNYLKSVQIIFFCLAFILPNIAFGQSESDNLKTDLKNIRDYKIINDIVLYNFISDEKVREQLGEVVELRKKNSRTFKNEDKYKINVYNRNIFEKVDNDWFYLKIATTTVDNWKVNIDLNINEIENNFNFLNEVNAYEVSDSFGSGSLLAFCDVWEDCVDSSSSSVFNGVSVFFNIAGDDIMCEDFFGPGFGYNYCDAKSIHIFNTSDIPNEAIIKNSVFVMTQGLWIQTGTNDHLNLKSIILDNPYELTSNDWDNEGGAISLISLGFQCGEMDEPCVGTINDNSIINKSGITSILLETDYDSTYTAPDDGGIAYAVYGSSNEMAPYLVIEYELEYESSVSSNVNSILEKVNLVVFVLLGVFMFGLFDLLRRIFYIKN